MSVPLPSRKTVVIALAALYLVYLLLASLALPPLLQSQAEKFVAERTGHRLTMDKPAFNPFTLALRLSNLRLEEPDGKPLLVFKELLVDVSATSLFKRAYAFDAIRLDGLQATIAELPGDRLNWSALIDSLKGKEQPAAPAPAEPTPMPRIDIDHLAVTNGRIDVADRRRSPEFATRVEPLDVELDDLSTLPNESGKYEITAHTGFGARIRWQGEQELNPLAISGTLAIEDVDLAKLAPLIKLPPKMAPPEGIAALSTHYRLAPSGGQIDLVMDQLTAKLAGLKVRGNGAPEPVLALESIEAKDGRFDLRQRSIGIGAIVVAGGEADLRRGPDGRLNVIDLLPATEAAESPTPPQASAPPWHYRVDRVDVSGLRAGLRDQTVAPPAQFSLADVS
ncbi:MAG TPA: DUF748 domain-containing protein, partial [Rhodocyclaceae bacterium]|nr:DUF748 domain-containing protein [Rhodocyclaceae bacterium]